MKSTTQQMLGNVVKLACLLAIVYFVLRCIDAKDQEDIAVQPTPIEIQEVRPIGELYAYTAITEDFTIDNVEKVGFFTRSYYKSVQMLRMQVSFVIDLDSVDYIRQEQSDTVIVRLPQLRFVQASQGSRFLCEVEVPDYNAARAIQTVERKIKSHFDTPANRQKAMAHVREVLSAFVQQFGLVPKFEEKH